MKRFDNPILVTRPYLPDLEEFKAGCEVIWKNQWLTNNGPMLNEFHSKMAKFLGVSEKNIALFNNGTLALELGFYSLGLAGGEE
jgi:dTDP-4-amino-4,6-dideoxygalactose transaminase